MNKFSRKSFFSVLVVALFLILLDATGLNVALADHTNPTPTRYTINKLDPKVELPSGSPNPNKVYFPDFGQYVANPLLRFWRVNGRFDSLGGPMSRTFMDEEGNTIQYFQKMAIAYSPALANTSWETRPYHIGRLFLNNLAQDAKIAAPFAKVPAIPNTATRKYFPETGHTLVAGFLDLYNRTGALFMWGFPLSEEYIVTVGDKQYNAQLFERGRMLWSQATGAMIDPGFGTEVAGLTKAPVSVELNPEPLPGQARIPNYSTNAWEHWVDINLAGQYETFYEGDVAVRNNLVTTGKSGYETPTGTFYIWSRVYNERMKGGSIGSEDYYDLSNVLFTQYFTYAGHALHYAWWRSQFGIQGSHGCVNEDYESAEFAWNWLTIGSRLNIHY